MTRNLLDFLLTVVQRNKDSCKQEKSEDPHSAPLASRSVQRGKTYCKTWEDARVDSLLALHGYAFATQPIFYHIHSGTQRANFTIGVGTPFSRYECSEKRNIITRIYELLLPLQKC